LDVLKELELSTLVIRVLPSVIRSVKSNNLQSVRFFLLVHQIEHGVDHATRHSWNELDFELCALANRVQAASQYRGQDLRVKFVDLDPTTPVWTVEQGARVYLPRANEHRYIDTSFSVG